MRTGIVVLGVVFLMLSGILYALSSDTLSATTTTSTPTDTDTRVSSASVNIPWEITTGLLIIGLVLGVVGLILPNLYETRSHEVID